MSSGAAIDSTPHRDGVLDARTLDRAQFRSRLGRRVAAGAAVALIALLLTAAAAFWLTGGRWYVVRTPSMGTAAPVGTLILTRPTSIPSLHVGQVIAFHPPSEPSETYTHRIVVIADGQVHTRGDINGATDPWALTSRDIIGRATVIIPRVGWLARAAPLLLIGNLAVWIATALWLRPEQRGPVRTLGAGLLFSLACYLLKPFTSVVQLATNSTAHGSSVTAVSTGLLPVQLRPLPGRGTAAPVDLSMGQVGLARFTGGKPGEQYLLSAHLHLSLTQWMIMALIWAIPLLWTMTVGYQPAPPATDRAGSRRTQPVPA